MKNEKLLIFDYVSKLKFGIMICVVLFSTPIFAQIKADKPVPARDTDKAVQTESISLEELIKTKSPNYVITSQHVSSTSGIHHIYLRQAINGLEIAGTESSIHLGSDGKKISTNNRFIPDINATLVNSTANLSAEEALTSISQQMGYNISDLQTLERKSGINQKTLFNKAGISGTQIPAKLMYYYREGIGTTIVWELSVQEITSSDWWNFRVDASSGVIIDKDNWTVSCLTGLCSHYHNDSSDFCEDDNHIEDLIIHTVLDEEESAMVGSYRVYPLPIESPNHGGRTLEVNPDNGTASPFGWHDTNGAAGNEYTYTRGNNVQAYDDDNANNAPDGKYAFSPGGNMVFDFTINTNYSNGNQSEDAAVTNLFYWSNIIHDVLYQYGFDEASGNFQENNYGNGGAGSDSVNAEAQDGSGTCNANFGTPADGGNPRMQMYVCGSRDGDLDNGVIIHEYGHGISNRLTGGPGAAGCLGNTEQMGEGWSDYYGLVMTIEPGDTGTDPRGMGTWLVGETASGPGIRTQRYDTDDNTYTYDSIKTEVAPHGVGSVWAMMLWEMTWDLIAVHGYDSDIYNGTGGNNISLNLVTEGMKLQPCSPGFVDGRDAILLADQNIYGGANQCTIWDAFARRGLGYSAIQGSTNSKTDGTQAFDLPPGTAAFSNSISKLCITEGIQNGLGGGTPSGGVYSGLGVTDDGNGNTYTFDPNVAGLGTATVTYTVNDSCSGGSVNLDDTIEVSDGIPVILCQDITISLDASGNAVLDPFANQATLVGGDNQSNNPGYSALMVTLTADATLTFDWDYSTTDLPQYDSFGYILGTTYFALSATTGNPQSGSFSIDVAAGQDFGFCTYTSDNTFGAATGVVTNFSPGFIGQFAAANWSEVQQESDGVATIDLVNMLGLVDSCGTITSNLSQSTFSCLDIGENIIDVSITDNTSSLTSTCTTTVTVLAGAASTSTFSGGSWSAGTPTSTTIAVIDDAFDSATDGDIAACSCTINDNRTVNISAGNFMNIEGNINVDGTLIVEHQGSVVQTDPNAAVNKNASTGAIINVDVTTPPLKQRDFMVMGSPMTGETRDGVYSGAYNVQVYTSANFLPHPGVTPGGTNFADDNQDAWNPASASQAINPGEGNLVYPQASYYDPAYNGPPPVSTIVFPLTYTQGTLNNGNISRSVIYNGGTNPDGTPNILANPYASSIDASVLIANNSLINEVYFWEHLTPPSSAIPGASTENFSMDDISMYNGTMGVPAANDPGTSTQPNGVISTGQGFGIKSFGTGTVTFTNSMRLTTGNTTLRTTEGLENLMLKVASDVYELRSYTGIGFRSAGTPQLDDNMDSNRLATMISLYSHLEDGSEQLGIQTRERFESGIKIPMGFASQVEEDALFVISIAGLEGDALSNASIYLIDHLENSITDLTQTSYEFKSNKGTFNGRFTLQFESEILSNNDLALETISLYPNPTSGQLNILSPGAGIESITIHDVRGRKVAEVSLNSVRSYQVDMSAMESSLYFVTISTERGSVTKRIVKK